MFDPKIIALGVLLPLGLTAGLPALAQDGPGAEMFAELDTDGDGMLSLEELQAGPEARFARADIDGDGTITRDEMEAQAMARAAAAVERFFEANDADGDGAVSEAELAEAQDTRHAERREEMAARIFGRLDADGDGAISAEEFEEARGRMGERLGRGGPFGHRG